MHSLLLMDSKVAWFSQEYSPKLVDEFEISAY